eukprot:TRINITY_DN733_c0_g1_i22.p4 TRINITY_DN733_c0_g1~~TRINITY_DN733_c0_g1_i22.p4  ORF type:complete len:108 (+),score=46.46 TRINITY_DN733_c0_g1_i22:771-1094(+)
MNSKNFLHGNKSTRRRMLASSKYFTWEEDKEGRRGMKGKVKKKEKDRRTASYVVTQNQRVSKDDGHKGLDLSKEKEKRKKKENPRPQQPPAPPPNEKNKSNKSNQMK